MGNNIAYIVIISSEWGEDATIHSIFSSEASAEKARQELESNLSEDMIVYVESHEIFDS